MSMDRTTKMDFQFLLAMIPIWAHGDEDPTAMDVASVGGWERVEATRKRIDEIKQRMTQN